jgi:hypothetical protein
MLTYADVCGRSDKLRTRLRVLEAHVRADPLASAELSESEGQYTDKSLVQYVSSYYYVWVGIYRKVYVSSCDYIGSLRRIAYVSIRQHTSAYVTYICPRTTLEGCAGGAASDAPLLTYADVC